jgi:hypothetical protein
MRFAASTEVTQPSQLSASKNPGSLSRKRAYQRPSVQGKAGDLLLRLVSRLPVREADDGSDGFVRLEEVQEGFFQDCRWTARGQVSSVRLCSDEVTSIAVAVTHLVFVQTRSGCGYTASRLHHREPCWDLLPRHLRWRWVRSSRRRRWSRMEVPLAAEGPAWV